MAGTNVPTVLTLPVHIKSSTSNIFVQRHRLPGTNVPTVQTVSGHIKSSTSVVPVMYRHRHIEWLVPSYQQYHSTNTYKEQCQCSTSKTLVQRDKVAGTSVLTVPTVPVNIISSTIVAPVTYRRRDIEWLAPMYQQYPQYQYI